MYLTQIEMNPRRRASRRVLGSPHLFHGAVNACFPRSAEPGRLLWRVDERRDGVFLYVVSAGAPDPTGFVEEHGWPLADSWRTRAYGPVLDAVVDGRALHFRVRANPVRNLSPAAPDARGKRVGHVTADQQLDWFCRRAEGWGFAVGEEDGRSVRVVERRVWNFRRRERPVTVATATFEGVLTVTDAERLRASLREGFGPAKAYGCGLMTVAPRP
jgi:CRISPR system Cascade subunit CasE